MTRLVTLLRMAGILALLVALGAWLYPAQLSKLVGSTTPPYAASASPARPAPALPPALTAPAAHADSAPPLPAAWRDDLVPPPPPLRGSHAQIALARWLGSKYRTAPAVIEALMIEADQLSTRYRLSPNLLIAVMAIESNFHPYIQSEAGAQGLMQVMPSIHARRYAKFGGTASFLDPLVSLKVGAEILRDCVKLKGSENEGLRFYFGGGAASDGYIDKVRAEQRRLDQVAAGRVVPIE